MKQPKSSKPDLVKLFELEGVLVPRSPSFDTEEDIQSKNPHVLSNDIKTMLDEVNVHVISGDIDSVIRCISAIQDRSNRMMGIAQGIKSRLKKK